MGDGYWTQSTCRGDVWWWGVPGSGTWYWTARFGTQWVGGTVYQYYAAWGWECGQLGPPINPYGWVDQFGGGYGQWFENGCIVYAYGAWRVYVGQYGQLNGRLADEPEPAVAEPEAEQAPPPPEVAGGKPWPVPKAPRISREMAAAKRAAQQ